MIKLAKRSDENTNDSRRKDYFTTPSDFSCWRSCKQQTAKRNHSENIQLAWIDFLQG